MALKRLIDEQYTARPFFGIRKVTDALRRKGHVVNHKRVGRLMREMGLTAICPGPHLSSPRKNHKKYPYLLKGLSIVRPDQVWSTDITYIRLRRGFVYLSAIMDWFSRYVVAWALSVTLESDFCVAMLHEALRTGRPEIFNSDQGSQFTSEEFTGVLSGHSIRISMDGRGRAYDNIFVERLWRTVKYEEVYLKEYDGVRDAKANLKQYFDFYNNERPHQSLGYKTPVEVYQAWKHDGNQHCFAGGKDLIQSFVPVISDVLSQESVHCAPLERTHGDSHLKQIQILS
jgi:putative transposase